MSRRAAGAFQASAGMWRALPQDAWSGPTGCEKWDQHTLAGHIVGEAVWFANLVNGVTIGESALSSDVYENLKKLPPGEMAQWTGDAARAIEASIREASSSHLHTEVDLGISKMPLAMATAIAAMEGVIHN